MVAKVGHLAGGATYYAREVAAGEYLGAERPGVWVGRGASRLGLSGAVDPAVLERLFAGYSPDGKQKFVQNAGRAKGPGRRGRDPGREFQFAWDKSISAVFAVSDAAWRAALLQVLQSVVKEVLEDLNGRAGVTRRGKAGAVIEYGDLVFAAFSHLTNRNLEPHVHVHVCVPNLVLRADGTIGSLDNRQLYRLQKKLDTRFNSLLHGRLAAVGLDVRLRDGVCVAPAVPAGLLSEWASRRAAIKEALRDADPKDRHAPLKAALATRPAKVSLPETELNGRWRDAARRHGFDLTAVCRQRPNVAALEELSRGQTSNAAPGRPRQARERVPGDSPSVPASRLATRTSAPAPTSSARTSSATAIGRTNRATSADANAKQATSPSAGGVTPTAPPPSRARSQRAKAAPAAASSASSVAHVSPRAATRWVHRAVRALASRQATLTPGEIAARAQEIGTGQAPDVSPDAVASAVRTACHSLRRDPARFGLKAVGRDPATPVYTTPSTWRLEKRALRAARRLARRRGCVISAAKVTGSIERQAAWLRPEQRAAVAEVATCRARLAVVDGEPRGGRTTVAEAVARVYADNGFKVYAAAPTHRDAQRLGRHAPVPALPLSTLTRVTRRPGVFKTWWNVYRAVLKRQFPNVRVLASYAAAAHRRLKEPLVRLDRRSVVVIDNAEAAATADIAPLLSHAARAGAKVVLVGDSCGLPASRPGGLFRHLVEKGPSTRLNAPSASIPHEARAAARAIRGGNAGPAFEQLRRGGNLEVASGRVVVVNGRDQVDSAAERLLDTYVHLGGLKDPRSVKILTSGHGQASALNRRVQERRAKAGLLGEDAVAISGVPVRVNDLVRFPRRDRSLGVRAGEFGRVEGLNGRHARVRLSGGQLVTVPVEGTTRLQLGYALSALQARNRTFRHTLVFAATPLPGREWAATLLSRGTESTRVFTERRLLDSGLLAASAARRRAGGVAHGVLQPPPAPQPAPKRELSMGY